MHAALVQALQRLDRNSERPVLLGLQPDEPDTDLGYVLPGDADPFGGRTVDRFIADLEAADEAEPAGRS